MSREQLDARYGSFYAQRVRGLELDQIAPELWPLVPYAEVWGAGEPHALAPAVALEDLCRVVDAFAPRIEAWLQRTNPSPERTALHALLTARARK
jgi:hypothetical protein